MNRDGKKAESEARQARLAAALRANLKRRKTQARSKAEVPPQAGEGDVDAVHKPAEPGPNYAAKPRE